MSITLEKRVRKLEQTMEPKELTFDRDELARLRSTPEGREALRQKCDEMMRDMRIRARARIAAAVSPSALEGLKKQWAAEDEQMEKLGYRRSRSIPQVDAGDEETK
jgi:hypothetical protein